MSTPERNAMAAGAFRISYMMFDDVSGKSGRLVEGRPWHLFAEQIHKPTVVWLHKKNCPLISMCEYGEVRSAKGALRHKGNVRRVFGIEIDYDAGVMLLAEAADKLRDAGLRALLYTSPSHKPEAPRWRVLLPLSTPVDPKQRRALVGRANRVLGGVVAAESFSLSQSYYIGQVGGAEYATQEVEGQFIDRLSGIEPMYPTKESKAIDENQLRAEFASKGNDDGYKKLLSLSMHWARQGWDQKQIETELTAMIDARGTHDPTLRDRVGKLASSAAERAEIERNTVIGPSDDDLALRFADAHAITLRHVARWGRWLVYDGTRWAEDATLQVFDFARKLCRDARDELLPTLTTAQQKALRKHLGAAATIYNVVKLAGNDRRLAITPDQLDADPWSLNTPAGVIDLRTGAIRPHEPVELHTKITAAAPRGDCPVWHKTLERVVPDAAIRAYLQRLFGYGLTGSSRDHVVPFLYGRGRNGKGTIVHTMRRAMGDYGLEIPAEVLMESHNDRHPAELAVLHGARLVVGSEVDTGRRWNESRLKRLSGGDPISARFMGKDPFEFEPTHTLVLMGNSKPGLRAVDDAIRARIQLVDFAVTIPEDERDTRLGEKLGCEYGGILAWAIEGCVAWQTQGLRPPPSVLASTDEYLDGEDHLSLWLAECTQKGDGWMPLSRLLSSYRFWCQNAGLPPMGRNTLSDALAAIDGMRRNERGSRVVAFFGIKLRNEIDA